MNRIIMILTIALQITVTFITTFCIYLLFALLDNDWGFDGLFGLLIIQPIAAIIFSILTIFICLIIGLPIRLNKNLNHWWIKNFYFSIIGVVLGLILLFLALLPIFEETIKIEINGQPTLKQIPNTFFSIIGWFLTAFSILHTYPPQKLTENIKSFISKSI
jgi:uncharacterized protein YacL